MADFLVHLLDFRPLGIWHGAHRLVRLRVAPFLQIRWNSSSTTLRLRLRSEPYKPDKQALICERIQSSAGRRRGATMAAQKS